MDWQSIIATVLVLIAAAWLIRRSWRTVRRGLSGGPVSDCGHCPRSTDKSKSTPLVQLGAPPDPQRTAGKSRNEEDA